MVNEISSDRGDHVVFDIPADGEPEVDDDSITERNEQAASGGWWPFG